MCQANLSIYRLIRITLIKTHLNMCILFCDLLPRNVGSGWAASRDHIKWLFLWGRWKSSIILIFCSQKGPSLPPLITSLQILTADSCALISIYLCPNVALKVTTVDSWGCSLTPVLSRSRKCASKWPHRDILLDYILSVLLHIYCNSVIYNYLHVERKNLPPNKKISPLKWIMAITRQTTCSCCITDINLKKKSVLTIFEGKTFTNAGSQMLKQDFRNPS